MGGGTLINCVSKKTKFGGLSVASLPSKKGILDTSFNLVLVNWCHDYVAPRTLMVL